MKKYINELNLDELRKVCENNAKLREMVFDDLAETINIYISDYLDCFERGSIDYSLDVSGYYNYFTVKDFTTFLDGLKQAQEMYCLLSDDYNSLIDKAIALNEKYQNEQYYNLSDMNYERIEKRLTGIIETLENACYKRFRAEYDACYDDKVLIDYFLEFYVDERMDNDFYIDENYTLYQDIAYTKSYK